MTTPPAITSTSESAPKPISAIELALIPAPTAIANSTTCQALPPCASRRARRSRRARSARRTESVAMLMYLRYGLPALTAVGRSVEDAVEADRVGQLRIATRPRDRSNALRQIE